jgi:hypothetical protein
MAWASSPISSTPSPACAANLPSSYGTGHRPPLHPHSFPQQVQPVGAGFTRRRLVLRPPARTPWTQVEPAPTRLLSCSTPRSRRPGDARPSRGTTPGWPGASPSGTTRAAQPCLSPAGRAQELQHEARRKAGGRLPEVLLPAPATNPNCCSSCRSPHRPPLPPQTAATRELPLLVLLIELQSFQIQYISFYHVEWMCS